MSIARKNFNIDPKKGMEYMIQHNLVHNSPASVADFLYKGEGKSFLISNFFFLFGIDRHNKNAVLLNVV